MDHSFATAINCMDGRVQEPVIKYIQDKYNITYVDMITEPGPILILAEQRNSSLIDSIKARLDISINKHNSKLLALIGHFDCAGNPVNKEKQILHLQEALKAIKDWDYNIKTILLWVDQDWKVEELKELYC